MLYMPQWRMCLLHNPSRNQVIERRSLMILEELLAKFVFVIRMAAQQRPLLANPLFPAARSWAHWVATSMAPMGNVAHIPALPRPDWDRYFYHFQWIGLLEVRAIPHTSVMSSLLHEPRMFWHIGRKPADKLGGNTTSGAFESQVSGINWKGTNESCFEALL